MKRMSFRALGEMTAKGYLKQGFKPIYWCFNCQSSLADAEVEYQDKTSAAIDVKFPVVDAKQLPTAFAEQVSARSVSIVIWTTTPWTLPANQAVAVNPELNYALVQINEDLIILAEALVAQSMQRYGIEGYTVLATSSGSGLEGLVLQHPLLERHVPVILGDHVTTDAGTGAVHTAPAHGEDDFRVGKKYDLPTDTPVMG